MKPTRIFISPYLFLLIPVLIVLTVLITYSDAIGLQHKIDSTAAVFSFPHMNIVQCVAQGLGIW